MGLLSGELRCDETPLEKLLGEPLGASRSSCDICGRNRPLESANGFVDVGLELGAEPCGGLRRADVSPPLEDEPVLWTVICEDLCAFFAGESVNG